MGWEKRTLDAAVGKDDDGPTDERFLPTVSVFLHPYPEVKRVEKVFVAQPSTGDGIEENLYVPVLQLARQMKMKSFGVYQLRRERTHRRER